MADQWNSHGAKVLLDTVHGSRLYGLAHATSDDDRYIVLSDRPDGARGKLRWSRQYLTPGAADVFVTDARTFLDMCASGVPQSLEAMFSPAPTIDALPSFRIGYRAAGPEVLSTYARTVRSFLHSDGSKRRRHAIRLALNLTSLLETGRFDPVVPRALVGRFTDAAESIESAADAIRQVCPVDLV